MPFKKGDMVRLKNETLGISWKVECVSSTMVRGRTGAWYMNEDVQLVESVDMMERGRFTKQVITKERIIRHTIHKGFVTFPNNAKLEIRSVFGDGMGGKNVILSIEPSFGTFDKTNLRFLAQVINELANASDEPKSESSSR